MVPAVHLLLTVATRAVQPQAVKPSVDAAVHAPTDERLADIVVTDRRNRKARPPGAVDFHRRYCFDANRRTGRSLAPTDDPDWTPLDADSRIKFGVSDPDVPAFGLRDPEREQTLLLKMERLERSDDHVESRCTLMVVGGTDQGKLASGMSGVFGTAGTQRHVGASDGTPRIPGWRQRLWTAMPDRRSRSWKAIGAGERTNSDTWVVVSGPSFYDDHDYVMGDLKTRTTPGTPLSVLSFAFVTRSKGR